MSHLQLDALRGKLLRAGIAPVHVRRYLGELRQHFDDLARAEAGNGLSGDAALQAARARLGSDADLAAAMLARPDLRTLGARFPWAVFGLAPAVTLALLLVAAAFVQVGVMDLVPGKGILRPAWMASVIGAWNWSMMYLFPAVVAAIFVSLGARRFIKTRWLMAGVLLSALVGAAVHVSTTLSDLPGQSAFSVVFGFRSHADTPRLAASIILACAVSTLYWLWQRRQAAMIAD